jgi:2-keto-3-deoxy-L-rhamnonate aldolase RhmA
VKQDLVHDFKQRLTSGAKVFGPLIGPNNEPETTVAAIKNIGFDFFMIDNEHSMVGKEAIYQYIRLAREYELPIMMRPEDTNASARAYLDAGIQGLMVPQVDTVEQALFAVNQCYYPPVGRRGAGIGMSPYLLDGMDAATTPLQTMVDYVNRNVILMPQTESLVGIKELPRKLALNGITGTVVGTHDLALDIGDFKPGMLRSEVNSQPFIEEKLREVVDICRAAGKIAGMGGFAPKGYAKWAREGFQFFTLGYVRDHNVEKSRVMLQEVKDLIG